MKYVLILFVIALALAPLSHFYPSKRQRLVARMREYAAVHGLFVEFRDLPARGEPVPGERRAQVIYYIAENLSARAEEFTRRIVLLSGREEEAAREELDLCISRIWHYAAMADKFVSCVHATPFRNVTLAMKEPLGVIGIVAPEEAGMLGFVSTVMPAIAMGNRVVVVPSQHYALLATEFYQVLETSDLPGGVINIVTGDQDVLADTLARHLDLEGMWYWGSRAGSKLVEEEAAASMKRTWVNYGLFHDWADPEQGQGESFLRKAVEIKNIWIPYGE